MSKPTIICVDDERIVLNSLADQLSRHLNGHFSIELAESGEEALDLLNEMAGTQVDVPVIITDQIMPGLKGDELLIKAHRLLPKTLNILLTGQADAQAVGNTVNQASLYRYIAKPWEPADLVMTVKEALHSYFQDQRVAELHRRNQSLIESLQAFTRLVDPDIAYDELLSFLTDLFRADRCQIMVKSAITEQVEVRSASPTLKDVDFSRDVLNQAINSGQIMCIIDMVKDPAYKNHSDLKQESFLSVIVIPLQDKEKETIGALYLDRRNAKIGPFSESDKEQIIQIAEILTPVLQRQEEARRLQIEAEIHKLGLFVGDSPVMKFVYNGIEQAAKIDLPVYIQGETGTGKELAAEALHKLSSRRDKPFIAINCAAIPRELAEDELFGHEKGAFTGAVELKRGKFELAHQGTLFLDEIADLPIEIQAKLLRVLEQNALWRVGGQSAIEIDVRIIAATSLGLEKQLKSGKFRQDLFHRLNVLNISLPPLRKRKEDIPLLAYHFLRKYTSRVDKNIPGFTSAFLEELQQRKWPGNVRELENEIAKLVVTHKGNQPIHLASDQQTQLESSKTDASDIGWLDADNLDDMHESLEEYVVKRVLNRNNWNKNKTATELSISRNRLNRIIERHGLRPGKKK